MLKRACRGNGEGGHRGVVVIVNKPPPTTLLFVFFGFGVFWWVRGLKM